MTYRPVVPEINDHKAIDALHARMREGNCGHVTRSALVEIIRIMHEPPKPATKVVQVWRVEWAERLTGDREWRPRSVGPFIEKRMAEGCAGDLAESKLNACIRVTGPHDQEVPNA